MIAIEARVDWLGHTWGERADIGAGERQRAVPDMAPVAPSAAMAPRAGLWPGSTIAEVLAAWRAAERALAACPTGDVGWPPLAATASDLRDAYHRLFDEHWPRDRAAAAHAPAIDWNEAISWLARRPGLVRG